MGKPAFAAYFVRGIWSLGFRANINPTPSMRGHNETLIALPDERIINRIFVIRGKKVMLDRDLAELYGVETRALNQAIRRNRKRFPEDFMFQLTWEEAHVLRSQIVILNGTEDDISKSQTGISRRGRNIKYLPYAFTEQLRNKLVYFFFVLFQPRLRGTLALLASALCLLTS